MAFIEWVEKNAVGIAEVDEQHKELFDMLNRLHASVEAGKDFNTSNAVLDDLIEYAVYHFNTEEVLLEECGYPKAEEHKEEHARLTVQALELQRDLREGNAIISAELLDTLHGWVMDHTTGLDAEFGEYLREQGIAVRYGTAKPECTSGTD